MKTLNSDEVSQVSGGLIGGGTIRGIPLCDASATREPGQNSYGETIPGGAAFYESAMSMSLLNARNDEILAQQVNNCTTGNLLACVVSTFQVVTGQLEAASRRLP